MIWENKQGNQLLYLVCYIRDGQLENLWGGRGRAKYKKNIRARKNEMKKIRAHQLTLKNIHAMG